MTSSFDPKSIQTVTITPGVGGCTTIGVAGSTGGSGIYTLPNTGIGIGTLGGWATAQPAWGTTGTVNIDPYQRQIDELRAEIYRVINRLDEESKMRKKYPALGYAYEQYEVMLEICKSKEADDAAGKTKQNP